VEKTMSAMSRATMDYRRIIRALLVFGLACAALSQSPTVKANVVPVRYSEGVVRGFLVVKTQDGQAVGDGDLIQVAHGDRVNMRMTLRFKDGSILDETTVFSQRGTLHLLNDHVVQKGPTFKNPMDTSIDAPTGRVIVRTTEDNGKESVITQHLDLAPDVANGLLLYILKNVQPATPSTTVSYVAFTPKPRIVHLVITPQGETEFLTGSSKHKTTNYDVKVDIGGATGVVAHLVGKQPPDTHVWILPGEAPTLVGLEGPLYENGPVWELDLASPMRQAAPPSPQK
jgi:hypothetical protein